MIGLLLDILNNDEYIGVSKNIDIAKGSNELPKTLKKGWKQFKRKRKWQ